jgi:ppGpp synthetase/RelA/SpoT-type nucleotidyltranferase
MRGRRRGVLDTAKEVDRVISKQCDAIEKNDKSDLLDKSQTVGYRSVHDVVHLNTSGLALPEYPRFRELVAEIQVRTILQHAWAETEHDTRYKAVDVAPTAIARRFVALAGLLEIADREFQALQDSYERITHEARQLVAQGRLNDARLLRKFLEHTSMTSWDPIVGWASVAE